MENKLNIDSDERIHNKNFQNKLKNNEIIIKVTAQMEFRKQLPLSHP